MSTDRPADAATIPTRGEQRGVRRRTLLILRGDDVELRPLPLSGDLTIGRGDHADIQLAEPSLSRAHLILALRESSISITDLGSANGTTLRGVRVPPQVEIEVSSNEMIGAGDLTLVVQDIGAVSPSASSSAQPSARLAAGSAEPIVIEPQMRRLYELAGRVARGSIPVLLIGESGTGKEVLAEFIHASSPRRTAPLVRVNCAALTDSLVESELFGHEKGAFTGALRERPGLLESANGGSVLLDEIGELPMPVQAKLLRVLEEGVVRRVGGSSSHPLDVRFLAATNRDLEAEVEAGRFRRDLYFRIAGAVLVLSPLRERQAEIEAIAQRFIERTAQRLERPAPRLSPAALARLHAHAWPGNVRELRNVIERAVLLADATIEPEHLPFGEPPIAVHDDRAATPAPISGEGALADQLASIERDRILAALDRCGGNQTRAAEQLGMPRRTLVKRLDQYGISRPRKK